MKDATSRGSGLLTIDAEVIPSSKSTAAVRVRLSWDRCRHVVLLKLCLFTVCPKRPSHSEILDLMLISDRSVWSPLMYAWIECAVWSRRELAESQDKLGVDDETAKKLPVSLPLVMHVAYRFDDWQRRGCLQLQSCWFIPERRCDPGLGDHQQDPRSSSAVIPTARVTIAGVVVAPPAHPDASSWSPSPPPAHPLTCASHDYSCPSHPSSLPQHRPRAASSHRPSPHRSDHPRASSSHLQPPPLDRAYVSPSMRARRHCSHGRHRDPSSCCRDPSGGRGHPFDDMSRCRSRYLTFIHLLGAAIISLPSALRWSKFH